jgi:branched-chain amino acid transport system ATP-binding protein
MALLELANVHAYYGAVHALKGISLSVDAGEIVGLIGSNGAGKSTTLRVISGMTPVRDGTIVLDGIRIDGMRSHQIVRQGISISPEGRRIFTRLTVAENLQIGAYVRQDRAGIAEDLERVYDLFPRLRERAGQSGATLSGGEQQMLAIGRALMARPRVLLLDEPTMGLAPMLVEEIFAKIRQLNEEGMTILLVEQNVHMALTLVSRAYIMQVGRIAMSGPASDLAKDESVRAVYFGEQ